MGIEALLNNPLFWLAAIWSLIWKGFALWRAARIGSKPWFVVLLLVNTVGLLEILYLAIFSKKGSRSASVGQ